MLSKLLNIKNICRQLFKKGFFSVVGSQVIIKAVSFCSAIFLVRILSKGDYGIYSYAQNLLSVLLLLDGIGTVSGITQYASENHGIPEKQAAFSLYGFKIGLGFNFLLCVGIFLYALFGTFKIQNAGVIVAIMSFQPVMSYIQNFCSCNLRFRFKNTAFSILNVVASVLNVVGILIGAYFFGVKGSAYSLYISYFLTLVCYVFVFAKLPNIYANRAQLTASEKKNFMKLSLSASVNESILHLIMVADTFLIGVIISDEIVIASYKVATAIPSALLFIPSSVMLFAYPYMARHNTDFKWMKKSLCLIVLFLLVVNIIAVGILEIWAPFFIKLIYGEQYLDAVNAFRILLIGYFFTGTLRTPLINFLWSQKKNLFVIMISVSIGLFNVVFDIVLIKLWGMDGAAVSTALTYFLSAVLSVVFALAVFIKNAPKAGKEETAEIEADGNGLNEDCGKRDEIG